MLATQVWGNPDHSQPISDAPSVMPSGDQTASPLQSLIDGANPGEIISLPAGSYEGPLLINKPLTVTSEAGATVSLTNGDSQEAPVTITAAQVILSELTIQDKRPLPLTAAIDIQANESTLENLHISTRGTAIQMTDSSGSLIRRNEIIGARSGNYYGSHDDTGSRKGNGIDLLRSHNNRMENNEIRHMFDGIYMEESHDNTAIANKVSESRYGYHIMFSNGNRVIGNDGIFNVTGAMVMGARNTEVSGNRFIKQTQSVSAQGMLVFDTYESIFHDNQLQGNRVGLYIESATDNDFSGNDISQNFIGMQLLDAAENLIANNAFVANVTQVQAIRSGNNKAEKNYWDDAQLLDLTGSGFSSLPYRADPFFLKLTEAIPPYQLFFGSPGMQFFESLFAAPADDLFSDVMPLMDLPKLPFSDASAPIPQFAVGAASLLLMAACIILIIFTGRRR